MKMQKTLILIFLLAVTFFPLFSQNASLSGTIETPIGDQISNVDIQLFDSNGTLIASQTSSGQYTFNNLTQGANYQLEFSKGNPLNGVSTFDMVVIARHILGITALSSQAKELAADINLTGSITTLDLVLMRRLILAIDQQFPVLPSWRFIAANNNSPGINNTIMVTVNNNTTLQNITGIKLGDVNDSVIP